MGKEEWKEGRKEKKDGPGPYHTSNVQRYPLPCGTHFGNLKCVQQGSGTKGRAERLGERLESRSRLES